MPRNVVLAPQHDRGRSLGWLAVAWTEHFCVHGPGDVQGLPVVLGDEYTGFVVDCYALDEDGERLYDSAFLSRPKGCDKSGAAARFCLLEAFGPCRFDGWAEGGEIYSDPWGLGFEYVYSPGEPMGRPVHVPFIRCLATEEGQTGLVYDTIHFNLTDDSSLLSLVPGTNAGLTRTYLPGGGEITPSTASSSSKDGGKETFAAFDESHLYKTPELRRMYATVGRNLRKRKKIAGTWFIETTTMFALGEESVAEETYKLAELSKEGGVKRQRLLFDHRWGDCEDLSDEKALRLALVDAYGDALTWNSLDGLVDGFYDPRSEPADSRRYFLNSIGGAIDAWIEGYEWAGVYDPDAVIEPKDVITMGFDGSRKRSRKVTDATALIGCRVSDGVLFDIGIWEQPDGPAGNNWEVPTVEVNAMVDYAFKTWNVVGFFADPAKWESYIADWESKYGSRLGVKATVAHPIQWWMGGTHVGAVVKALQVFLDAVVDKSLKHDGSGVLTRHVLNARRRSTPRGLLVAKEHPDSARKIDAAMAAVLAWQARLAAVAKGLGRQPAYGGIRKIR